MRARYEKICTRLFSHKICPRTLCASSPQKMALRRRKTLYRSQCTGTSRGYLWTPKILKKRSKYIPEVTITPSGLTSPLVQLVYHTYPVEAHHRAVHYSTHRLSRRHEKMREIYRTIHLIVRCVLLHA